VGGSKLKCAFCITPLLVLGNVIVGNCKPLRGLYSHLFAKKYLILSLRVWSQLRISMIGGGIVYIPGRLLQSFQDEDGKARKDVVQVGICCIGDGSSAEYHWLNLPLIDVDIITHILRTTPHKVLNKDALGISSSPVGRYVRHQHLNLISQVTYLLQRRIYHSKDLVT